MPYSRKCHHITHIGDNSMTILMTFIGVVVFVFSCFTAGFKTAFKRLMYFTLAGFTIDMLIILVASAVMFQTTL